MRRSIGLGLAALFIVVLVLVLGRGWERGSGRQAAAPSVPAEPPAPALAPPRETSERNPVPEPEPAPPIVPAADGAEEPTSARIEGRVVSSDGRSAVAGVFVFAKREDANWNAQSFHGAGLEVPGGDRAVSDEAGNFTIELSSPDARYDLAAGGRGYACKYVVRGVPAGERQVVVQVGRVYAIWLRIREVGGAMPRIPSELYGNRYGTARPVQSGPSMLQGSAPQLALAVFEESLARSSMFDRLYAYLSPSDDVEIGPVQLRVDWPGYEPAELSFTVPAVDGPIADLRMELQPVSECLAPVRVSWIGVPPDLPAGNSPEPSALLHFESEIAGTFDVAVRAFPPGTTALGDLPCGSYRVWWTPGSLPVRGMPEGEPTHMQLGPDGFTLSFDLSNQGWVQLEFVQPDGRPYGGTASILLGSGSPTDGLAPEIRVFHAPPYLFGPLDPGACFAYLDVPRMGDRSAAGAKAAAVEFEVLPGVVTGATSVLAGSR